MSYNRVFEGIDGGDLLLNDYKNSELNTTTNNNIKVSTCPVVASSPMVHDSMLKTMAQSVFRSSATRKPVGSSSSNNNSKPDNNNSSGYDGKTICLPKYFSQTIELHPVEETLHHFLENYGRCDTNLTDIPRPISFDGDGFMSPPLARNDNTRSRLAELYFKMPQWQNAGFFDRLIRPVLRKFRLQGASISLVDRTKQVVMFDIGLSMYTITRNVSLDGHALLSSGPLMIQDTTKDWRTAHNPLVRGPPFIRFYVGTPLVSVKTKNLPIGVVCVFSPYPRGVNPDNPAASLIETNEMKELQRILKQLAEAIMTFLDYDSTVDTSSNEDDGTKVIGPIGPVQCADLNLELGNDDRPTLESINKNLTTTLSRYKRERRHVISPIYMTLPEDFLNSNAFKWLECHPGQLKTHEIIRQLVGLNSSKKICEKVCEILVNNLELDIAYVVEARVLSTHDVDSTNLEKVFSKGNRKVLMRLFAGFGLNKSQNYVFDEDVHATVLLSNLGVQYNVDSVVLPYKSGIYMSFGKTDVEATTATTGSLSKMSKYGGYVIGGLSRYNRPFLPSQVEYMKICTASLDSMFIYS